MDPNFTRWQRFWITVRWLRAQAYIAMSGFEVTS